MIMRIMRIMSFCGTALLLAGFSGVRGIDLPPTPIQNQLKAGLLALNDRDKFNTPDSSKAARKKSSEEEFGSRPKSGAKAVLLSALIPGAGEYYLGHRGRALCVVLGL